MKKKIFAIATIVVIYQVVSFCLDLIYKIDHSNSNVIKIESLKINEDLHVPSGFMVLGKNRKNGIVEGTVFPDLPFEYKDRGQIEYFYFRFHPEWFEKNILPNRSEIMSGGHRFTQELVRTAKLVHEENFHYFMHLGDYPIVEENIVAGRIKMVGLLEREQFFLEHESNEKIGSIEY